MRRAWTTRLAWGLWALMLVTMAAEWVASAAWHAGAVNTSTSGAIAITVAMVVFGTVGALIATHVPGNPLGWIFIVIAIVAGGLLGLAEQLAYEGLVEEPGSVPGALLAAWVYRWAWFPTVGLICVVPLLYPTGTVPGPRWRFVLWALVGLFVTVTVVFMFYPGPLDDGEPPLPDNPVGIGALGSLGVGDSIIGISFLLLLGASALSMIVRFRHSRGDERQQMKWMTLAAVFLALGVVVPDLVGIDETGDVFFAVSVCLLPIAMGVAMLKYRLYDIDRLINRTLVYAGLTVALGAAYVGLVLGSQALFSSFAGGSNLAIAGSTLVVAALFLPARARLQRFVDRRFYRRRYDAQRTLGAFGSEAREQVHLEELTRALHGVVRETMQPEHVSVWLRESAR